MTIVVGRILPQARGGNEEMLVHLELSDFQGNLLDVGGGGGVGWQPYPMGENGWKDYNDMFPADNFGSPMYAVLGELVLLSGMVYTNDKTGHFPAIPEEARPVHRQRLNLNSAQGFFSADMFPDGRLKDGGGGVINPGGVLSLNAMYRRD